jgi:hypothetical protein
MAFSASNSMMVLRLSLQNRQREKAAIHNQGAKGNRKGYACKEYENS